MRTITIPLGAFSENIERKVIRQTLMEVTHHREQAAKLLEMTARSLPYNTKEYGIEV